MHQNRNELCHRYYFMYLFLLIIALCCSGCATTILQFELESISNSSKEIGVRNKALESKYCGQETINGKQFYRYMMTIPQTSCRYDLNIDMLLPIDLGEDSKVFFRETSSSNTCANQLAQIYYYYIEPHNFNPATLLLKNPNQIFIVSTIRAKGEMRVHYKYTSKDQMERFANLGSDASDLKWKCRNKGEYVTHCVLMPFAVVFDAITWPIQLWLLSSLNHP